MKDENEKVTIEKAGNGYVMSGQGWKTIYTTLDELIVDLRRMYDVV